MFSFVTRVCCTCDRGIRYAWYVRSKKKNIVFPVTILGHIPSHKHRSADQISRNKIRRWPRGGPKTHRRTRTPTRLANPDYPISSRTSTVDHSGVKKIDLVWQKFQVSRFAPESPKISLRQFVQSCDSGSVCPSSCRRLCRLGFCLRTFTYGFAVWILPPTGSLSGASGTKKLPLHLLEPPAREFASGLEIGLRRNSLHFSSVLHPCCTTKIRRIFWHQS